jgi:polysaccharide biosynthesis protein PslH
MRGLATCGLGADSPRQVLYLTHHSPWPAHSGGTVREAQLLTALSAEFRIDVVGVCRSMAADPGEVAERLGVRSVDFFGDEARRTLRRQRYSAKLEQLLTCQPSPLEHVDLVHVEGGYLFHLLPATRHDRTCLVEHNIESDILGQIARIRGSAALMRTSYRVARLEERAWQEAAVVAAVTAEDQAEITRRTGRTDVRVVPNGADHIATGGRNTIGDTRAPTVLFLANHNYAPNADALDLLLSTIWPAVHARLPRARLVIAGSGLPDQQRHTAHSVPGVEVVGFVADLSGVFDRADVLVCPLRVGGGVKVKVLEALRRGCPVVTTTIGAQGVHGTARSAVRIVNSIQEMVEATTAVLGSPQLRARRRAETLAAGASLMSWREASATLAAIWSTMGGSR